MKWKKKKLSFWKKKGFKLVKLTSLRKGTLVLFVAQVLTPSSESCWNDKNKLFRESLRTKTWLLPLTPNGTTVPFAVVEFSGWTTYNTACIVFTTTGLYISELVALKSVGVSVSEPPPKRREMDSPWAWRRKNNIKQTRRVREEVEVWCIAVSVSIAYFNGQ